jgi:hypothetical protein
MGAVLQRYSLEESDVVDCEELMQEVKALPVFMAHSVFLQLARVDYY